MGLKGKNAMKILHLAALVLLFVGIRAEAATYFVRPDGDNANAGSADTPKAAWRSIDCGQPTRLEVAAKGGESELKVAKADHFPPQGVLVIKGKRVAYTGRTAKSFTGCSEVPAAPKGELVFRADFNEGRSFKPGDIVQVSAGLYAFAIGDGGRPVAAIEAGGLPDQPVVYRAVGRVILDARDNARAGCLHVSAANVILDGFECRRPGGSPAILAQGENVEIRNCRIHDAGTAIQLSGKNQKAHHNIVYPGAEVGIYCFKAEGADIHHNTIHGIKRAILLTQSKQIGIHQNIVSRTKYEAVATKGEQDGAQATLGRNVFWAVSTDVRMKNQKPYGAGITPGQGDITLNPMFASFNPDSPNFLALLKGSPALALEAGARGEAVEPEPPSMLHASVMSAHNLVGNPSFEAGWNEWKVGTASRFYDDTTGYSVDETQACEGRRSLKLWTTPGAEKPAAVNSIAPLEKGKTYTLSVYARTDQPGKSAGTISLARPSYHGAWFMGSLDIPSQKLNEKWQRFSSTFTVDYDWPADGSAALSVRYGTLWYDCVQLEEGDKATPYGDPVEATFTTGKPGNLAPPGGKLDLSVASRLPNQAKAELSIDVTDVRGNSYLKKTYDFDLGPGAVRREQIGLPANLSGLAFLRWNLEQKEGSFKRRGVFRFAVGEPAARTDDYFFASSPHFEHMPYGYMGEVGEAIAAYGVTTLRPYLGERDMLRLLQPGPSRYDRLLADGQRFGLKMLITLDDYDFWKRGTGETRKPGDPYITDERRTEWARLVGAMAERYGDRVKVWEISNEPNAMPALSDGSQFTPEEYAKLLEACVKAIKSKRPDNIVLGGSITIHYTSQWCRDTLRLCAKTYDGFAFHPYTVNLNPDFPLPLRTIIDFMREDQRKAGFDKPFWFTEEYTYVPSPYDYEGGAWPGRDVNSPELTEEEITEANIEARKVLISLGEGIKSFTFHTYPGLLEDSAYTPHARLAALYTMKRLVGSAKPLRRLSLPSEYSGYLFGLADGTATVAVWQADHLTAQPKRLSFAAEVSEAFDFVGGKIEVAALPGASELTLPVTIAYLHSAKTQAEALAKAVEAALAAAP